MDGLLSSIYGQIPLNGLYSLRYRILSYGSLALAGRRQHICCMISKIK